MVPPDLKSAYQWTYRPQTPRRPDWFTQWPGGNRIAVTINVMHEWESAPGASTVRKRPMSTGGERTDFLGRLACNDGQGRVANAFAAGLLGERHLPAKETALDPAMLINALLASRCLGGQALSETTRQALTRKLSDLAN